MNDSHQCNYVSKNEAEFEEPNRTSEDETDEACSKLKAFEAVAGMNKNVDVGILKDHNSFFDNSGVAIFSNLHSSKNYTYNDYICSKKDKALAGLNDIRKVCDDISMSDQNEETPVISNIRINAKENNEKNCQTLTPKTNDKCTALRDSQDTETNGAFMVGDNKDTRNTMTESNAPVYYAVHIPVEFADMLSERKDGLHVYTDKEEVLKVMKLNKKARFKQFKHKKDAEEFALNGAEILSQEGSAIADSEKVMPFKRPKTEDMIQFRKFIERGDIESVQEKIFENPKYLVSNGDTPSILQEGSRYNALHVAAKAKNAKIASLILDSITRIDFISYLYDDNDIDSCIARSQILLDRYLNTPDKGSNETPLHLAVKHGAVEVVKVLLSYSQCQKNDVYNRYHELPRDIICSRVCGPCEETKAAIASMLEEQYFVPVLRFEDNSLQPKVGELFSLNNPLKLKSDLLSPRIEIQAYAGPMSKEKAELFKKKWKIPSRSVKELNSSLSLRLRDTEKGLEKTGRNLASELGVPWQEYWAFLDTFIDLSSQQGLQLLESYLKNRFQETFDAVEKPKDLDSSVDSNERNFCSISDLCETFELCGPQEKQISSPTTSRSKRHPLPNSGFIHRDDNNKKANDLLKNYGKNPLVYVERSCEVFGKRVGAAIGSCVLYENHAESLKECLETQVKHLLSLIKSYKEDVRFQSVDFQLVHSRVAAIAIQSLQDVTRKDKQSILTALKEIDWSDGALSDDEDLNYNFRGYSNEWFGVTTKQLHCLVKHLLAQLHDFQESAPQLSPSAREESHCQMLWAVATPCGCTWGSNASKRSRGGLKRKQYRNDCECDCDVSPRKIQFEDEKDSTEPLSTVADDSEDHFSTPSSGNSDSEEMEDISEIPNTFIYPGSLPTKTDFAVLEAIEKVPLSSEKYPSIYLWRHILQLQPKSVLLDHHNSSPDSSHKRALNFDSSISSPRKFLDRSFGSCESPPVQTSIAEPWERVTGPYSPRRSMRSSLTNFLYESPLR